MAGKAAVMNSPSAAERDQQQQTALIGNNYAAITFFRFLLPLFFLGGERECNFVISCRGEEKPIAGSHGRKERGTFPVIEKWAKKHCFPQKKLRIKEDYWHNMNFEKHILFPDFFSCVYEILLDMWDGPFRERKKRCRKRLTSLPPFSLSPSFLESPIN